VLLLVTDGNRTGHRASRRSATRAVQRSETLVYALGIGHSGRESLVGRIVAAVNGPQMGLLRALAGDSGGRAELVDDLNGAGRPQIVDTIRAFGEELRQQYTIGYYPPAQRAGKPVRRIRVTTRQPGQMVRARTVYIAAP
jgi:VWFA-related protein